MGGRTGGRAIDGGERELLEYLVSERRRRRRELAQYAWEYLDREQTKRYSDPDRVPQDWVDYRELVGVILSSILEVPESADRATVVQRLGFGGGRWHGKWHEKLPDLFPGRSRKKPAHTFHSLHEEACLLVYVVEEIEDCFKRALTVPELRVLDWAMDCAIEIVDQHRAAESRESSQAKRQKISPIDAELSDLHLRPQDSDEDIIEEVQRRLKLRGITRAAKAIRSRIARKRSLHPAA